MKWLGSDDAPSDAVQLREELAYLLFYGDPTWASNDDSGSVSDYRAILAGWFSDDASSESEFIELTKPGNESANARDELVSWFTPVVEKWKQWAKTTEGAVEKGIPNPNYEADQTPGTQYYWYDPGNEVYLYASAPDAPDADWLSYEDRRYTPVAFDDDRKTNYRQDVVTSGYEFQSRVRSGKWLTQAEWDQEVQATGNRAGTGDPQYTVPVYDAGFQMYRRFNSVSRTYEYADDAAADTWLTTAEATAKLAARNPAEQQPAATGQEGQAAAGRVAGDAASQIGLAAIKELAAQDGIDLGDLPAEELAALTADVLAQRIEAAGLAG
ncbi:MAG TPA: hypothetical protein VGI74_05555 [Streptosporangiaceae bacterium]|jgi:hypothetical protein